jgi:hypothetical protein
MSNAKTILNLVRNNTKRQAADRLLIIMKTSARREQLSQAITIHYVGRNDADRRMIQEYYANTGRLASLENATGGKPVGNDAVEHLKETRSSIIAVIICLLKEAHLGMIKNLEMSVNTMSNAC